MWPREYTMYKQVFSKTWPGDLLVNPTEPIFERGLDTVTTNILTKFQVFFTFPKIWPSDLHEGFDPAWPTFELVLDIVIFNLSLNIVKTNILTKFHQNRITNVVSRVKTSNADARRTTDDGRRTTMDD